MKKNVFIVLSFFLLFSGYSQSKNNTNDIEKSIQLMNYVTLKSQEISSNKSNRLELEDIKLDIQNNLTYRVDDDTQIELENLWTIIDRYTLNSRQRERIQYLAEQERAQAIKDAVPNPMYILSWAASGDPVRSIISIVSAAASSVISYKTSVNQLELETLKQNWSLDDEQYKIISEQSLGLLKYCQTMSKNYDYTDDVIIRPNDIERFIEYKNDSNLKRRHDDLKDDVKFIKANFASYFILLGETNFALAEKCENEHKDYLNYLKECINCYNEYIAITGKNKIYVKDIELARFTPKVIYSASKVLAPKKFISFAYECLKTIEEETLQKDWDLRYYASTVAVQLAQLDNSHKYDYYDLAKKLLMANVRYLSKEQESIISEYIKPVDESEPVDLLKKDKNTYKAMIKKQKKARETELVPFNQALYLNTELLFWLTDYVPDLKNKWNKDITTIVNDSVINEVLRNKYGLKQNINIPLKVNLEENTELDVSVDNVFTEGRSVKKVLSDIVIGATFPGLYYLTYKSIFVGDKMNKVRIPAVFLSDSSVLSINAIKDDSDDDGIQEEIKLSDIKDKIKVIRPDKKGYTDEKMYLSNIMVELDLKKAIEEKKLSEFDNVFIIIQDFDHNVVINCLQNDLSKSKKFLSKFKFLKRKSKD